MARTPLATKCRTPPTTAPFFKQLWRQGADYLVTNDTDLLALSGYEGLRILSMSGY